MKMSLLYVKEVGKLIVMQMTKEDGWNRIDISNNSRNTKVVIVKWSMNR